MRLDGFGLFVNDMTTMVQFYRDVLGFEIKEGEDAGGDITRYGGLCNENKPFRK